MVDDDWQKAQTPDTLCSGWFGPCIVITLYDNKRKEGYMWHFHTPDDSLTAMIENALETSVKEDLKVFIRGGAYPFIPSQESYDSSFIQDGKIDTEYNRNKVKTLLTSYFSLDQLDFSYITKPWLPGEVTLDLKTGNLEESYTHDLLIEND